VTDTDTGIESPDFDRWGSRLDGPPADFRRRRPTDLSLVRVAMLAVVVAALVALIVHFAGGGRAATRASGPTTRSGVAAAINVKLADLTGFHAGSRAGVSVGSGPATAFAQCLGSSVSPAAAAPPSFQSPDFVSGTGLQFVSLSSTVGFAPASVLASDAALAADSHFAPCVANALAALTYRAHGLAITSGGGAQATPLSFPPSAGHGVHAMLGLRASMTWSVNGLNFPVFVDLYVVTLGHDELSLFALSSEQPYSIATEDRLVGLLERRAQRNRH
jgi:hypothetical protein